MKKQSLAVSKPGPQISLQLPADTTPQAWTHIGLEIIERAKADTWQLADWAAFGEPGNLEKAKFNSVQRIGSALRQFCELHGLSYSSMKVYAMVARNVPAVRRLTELTFQHHMEVAALSPALQKKWLARALKENISCAKLRGMIRESLGEFDPEKVHGNDGGIFDLDRVFCQADSLFERNADALVKRKDYFVKLAMPMLQRMAAAWPDVVEIKRENLNA